MKHAMTSRDAALEALYRVEVRSSYADLALEGILKGANLDPRDRRLATELTFGCIRWRKRIDYILNIFVKGKMARLDPYTRNILRLGAYQVFFLDRVPDYAAISEAVKQSKKFGSKGCSSLVNGVLRSMTERRSDITFPDGKRQPVEHISTLYSHPRWLVDRWVKRYGVEETQRLCEANNSVPPLSIRANTLKATREELSERLKQEDVRSQPGNHSSSSLSIAIKGDLASLEAYKEGLFQVQDESSIVVSDVLDPRPGEVIVDLCSGPGGKATNIAELMQDEGLVIAVDIRGSRLKFVLDNAARLGLNIIVGVVADGQFFGARSADRILVDAPCSGLGVLRRRADLRWRMNEKEIVNLSRLQLALLLSAADSLRAGGVLVYSTCTIEPEENELVVSKFLELRSDFQLEDAGGFVADGLVDEEGFYRTLPHRQGLDGAFAARMVKAGK